MWEHTDSTPCDSKVVSLISQPESSESTGYWWCAEHGKYLHLKPEPFTTPCELCTGNSACYVLDNGVRRPQTSAEWCAEMKVCAATIEWDRLAEENQGY